MFLNSCPLHAIHIHRISEYYESVAFCLQGWVHSYRSNTPLHDLEHDNHFKKSVEHSKIENPCNVLQKQDVQKTHGKEKRRPELREKVPV